jgi:hypothetical protein
MAVRIQQLGDYGTSEPILARLAIQFDKLMEFHNISEAQRQNIFQVMHSEVVPKLVVCSRIKEQLTSEIRSHQKQIDEKGLEFQAQGRAYTLPSVINLRHHAETFLYNAKSALRDFTVVFKILFSKDFKNEARYDKVHKWAEVKFGSNDVFSKMLADDLPWIKRLIAMRNAIEHPEGFSGILHVENFTSEEKDRTVFVIEPVWYLNSEKKIPLAHDMDVFVKNLLTFCEESLLLCLEKFPSKFPVGVTEIPEAERDPKCPIRFQISFTGQLPR